LPKANYILQTNAKEEKSEAKVENKKKIKIKEYLIIPNCI